MTAEERRAKYIANLVKGGGRPHGPARERWWSVPLEWEGETCFILAGGPSLLGFGAEILQGRARVIAINDSYRLAPWADVLYWCDTKWWDSRRSEVTDGFTGDYIVTLNHPLIPGTRSLRDLGQIGLSSIPDGLMTGCNSGYAAINLAYLFGAKRICLLGYDMHVSETGRTHWHSGYGKPAHLEDRKLRTQFAPMFAHLVEPLAKAGVEVYNCTAGSALTIWPMRPLGWCLRQAIQDRDAKFAHTANLRPLSFTAAT